jgi:hypothetical protein
VGEPPVGQAGEHRQPVKERVEPRGDEHHPAQADDVGRAVGACLGARPPVARAADTDEASSWASSWPARAPGSPSCSAPADWWAGRTPGWASWPARRLRPTASMSAPAARPSASGPTSTATARARWSTWTTVPLWRPISSCSPLVLARWLGACSPTPLLRRCAAGRSRRCRGLLRAPQQRDRGHGQGEGEQPVAEGKERQGELRAERQGQGGDATGDPASNASPPRTFGKRRRAITPRSRAAARRRAQGRGGLGS